MRYVINKGDTLSAIAKTHGISLQDLLDANQAYKSHPNFIKPGDILEIPDGEGPQHAPDLGHTDAGAMNVPAVGGYLDDDTVVLSRGSIDSAGAKTYGKAANVPEQYVVALQLHLSALGFAPGAADGFLGNRTTDALKAFQQAALAPSRLDDGKPAQVACTFRGEADGECDAETRNEIQLWLAQGYRVDGAEADSSPWKGPERPANVNGIPFATSSATVLYWPILTQDRGGREVAYQDTKGKIYGRPGRRFLADRPKGRYHVGVDLWGEAGDIIVACENGTLVSHYHFTSNVDALFEQCDSGLVINYGEVKPGSWLEFGVQTGSTVKAGQPIARVGKMTNSSMCHFETYVRGTQANQRYFKSGKAPSKLLNPTQYLLHLAELGLSKGLRASLPPLNPPGPSSPPPDFPGMDLLDFHRAFTGGVRWRLTPQGLEVEGSGIERTGGAPETARRIWEDYNGSINKWATHYNVPCVLIVAIIATESSGHADALRKEPGYISDAETPHRISPGLMQTLISTARGALNNSSIGRADLLDPDKSIEAGTAYIASQRGKTRLDPPKVACAYNAGSLLVNTGAANRWKMRQYPIGTSAHCDRFVKWFNDAVAVLESHTTKPSVPYEECFF